MKHILAKISLIILLLLPVCSFHNLRAQEILEIPPLFDYPVAPEDLETLADKSNYLVAHFWDEFDFKNKQAVDQIALNDAFRVYSTPLRLAELNLANQSVDKLLDKLASNPTLLIQFTKAAEENLYGPRAEVWIDDIYLKFVDAALKNKKVSELRKEKLRKTSKVLHNNLQGEKVPSFDFTGKLGEKGQYFPMSTPTIIIFGDPENTDWRIARLRMETNSALSQAVDKGKINILFMIPFEMDNWQESVSNYNEKWVVGENAELPEIVDIRIVPQIYVVGNGGKLLRKNIPLELAISYALELVESPT